MTETTTVTCRSVCERLVEWQNKGPSNRAWVDTIASDARLALAQPDGDADLRAQLDAQEQRIAESKRLASEWQKRVEEAAAEIVRLRGQRDGTDDDLSKMRFLANWLLDRLVERSAV